MRTHRRLGAIAVIPLLLATLAACQPGRRDPASIERIIVVGDSIAHGAFQVPGFIDYLGEFYPNAEIVALGGPATSPMDGFDPRTGWSDWAGQVNHWLYHGFDADLVIIQGCCNDYTTQSAWRGSLDAVISKARGYDPGSDRRIVLTTSLRIVPGTSNWFVGYGVDKMIENTNYVIRNIPGVALADLDFAWSVNWGPAWNVPGIGVVRYADGLHFNETGARAAAEFISRY